MTKKHTIKELKLDELSLVDNPANQMSKIAIYKRGENASFKDTLNDKMEARARHEVGNKIYPLLDALTTSITNTAAEYNGEERDNKIRENIESFIERIRIELGDDMTDAEKMRIKELMDGGMTEEEATEKAKHEMKKDAGSPGTNQKQEEKGMDLNDLQKRLGDLEEQVTQLTKQAEDHGLSVEKSEDGALKLTKSQTEEYVEFGGEKIAKSQVPESVLKAIETQQEELKKMQADREKESLAKRADAELPNLKGTSEERGELLKAVDGIEDESVRKAVQESLKAADGFAKAAFAEIGKNATHDEHSATAQLESKVNKYATDHSVDYYTAYAEVTKSGEGKVLLNKSRAETRGQAN